MRVQPCEKSPNLHLLRSGLPAKLCLLIKLLFCFLFWQEIMVFRLFCVPQVMVKRIWGDSQSGDGTTVCVYVYITYLHIYVCVYLYNPHRLQK